MDKRRPIFQGWNRAARPVRLAQRLLMYEGLALYLRSGIRPLQAVNYLHDAAEGDGERKVLAMLLGAIADGSSLSRAFAMLPFPPPAFEVAFIEIGERSGLLPDNLEHLGVLLRRRNALRKNILGSLAYPLVVLLGAIATSGFLLFYSFPKIIPIFKSMRVELPLITRSFIAITGIVGRFWPYILAGVCVCVAIAPTLARSRSVVRKAEWMLLVLPLSKGLVRSYYLSVTSRLLAVLLRSGIPLVPALSLTETAVRHLYYRQAIATVGERVTTGRKFSDSLLEFPILFPKPAVQLIAAGEVTGSLSQSLLSLADRYEEELRGRTQSLTSLMEPALMIGMGLVVGLMAIAIIAPIYGITQNLTAW